MTTMKKAVGYIRVSTEDQAEHGLSLRTQRTKIEQYAALYDLELVAVFEDAGISGRSMKKRAGLQAALAAIREGRAETLIVTRLDRLSRSKADFEYLLAEYFTRDGGGFQAVAEHVDTTTAAGRLHLSLQMAVNQYQSEVTGERTSEVLKDKVRRGESVGRPPFGYRKVKGEKLFQKCPVTWPKVVKIRELGAAGELSLRAIGRAVGVDHKVVKRVLERSLEEAA